MKTLFILLDAVRYDNSDIFKFKGFYKQPIIAISNWTYPVLYSMITGLKTCELKAYSRPAVGKDFQWTVGNLRKVGYKTIFGLYSSYKCLAEIPCMHYLGIECQTLGMDVDTICKEIKEEYLRTIKEKDSFLLFLHFKAGHYCWQGNQWKFCYTNGTYEDELGYTSEHLEPFVEEIKDLFDNIIIVSDHGITDIKDNRPIGKTFDRRTLVVPLWTSKPITLEGDGIISSDNIFDLLRGNYKIRAKDFVVSAFPSFGNFYRIAITYKDNNDKFVIKEVEVPDMRVWI